jgi:hypothetical protein
MIINKIKGKRKKNRWKRRGRRGAGFKYFIFPGEGGGRGEGITRTFYIRNIIFVT